MALPAQRARTEPEISFEYIAAVRGPHPDGVTAVAFRPLVSAGWVIAGVITEYSGAVTVAVRPAPLDKEPPACAPDPALTKEVNDDYLAAPRAAEMHLQLPCLP